MTPDPSLTAEGWRRGDGPDLIRGYEARRYGKSGQLSSATLMDYLVPRATDLPTPELARIISPATSNPLGARGIGESGCIGFPPAMVLAVLDALKPLGVQHIDMPLDPSTVWAAIQHAGGSDPEEFDEGRLGAGHAREARTNSRTVHLSAECH